MHIVDVAWYCSKRHPVGIVLTKASPNTTQTCERRDYLARVHYKTEKKTQEDETSDNAK